MILKKNFNFIQSSKGSACCVLLLFTTSWDVLFPAWHDTSMYFEQIATTIKTCAISISKFETSKFAELDTIKGYNYILHEKFRTVCNFGLWIFKKLFGSNQKWFLYNVTYVLCLCNCAYYLERHSAWWFHDSTLDLGFIFFVVVIFFHFP